MNNEDIILKMLESMQSDIGSIKSELGNVQSDIGSMKSDIGSMQSDIGSMKSDAGSMQSNIGSMKSDIKSIQSDVNTLTKGQEKLHQDLTRLEYEHGDKLNILLDGYNLLHEKIDDHTERLERIEQKIETHDIEIQVLDKTKSNKRKAR